MSGRLTGVARAGPRLYGAGENMGRWVIGGGGEVVIGNRLRYAPLAPPEGPVPFHLVDRGSVHKLQLVHTQKQSNVVQVSRSLGFGLEEDLIFASAG